MPESSSSRSPFSSQRANLFRTLLKSALHHFDPNLLLISRKLSWKTTLLVKSEILGLFFNRLTAYYMYSRQNWENFSQQFKMQLSSKLLTFSDVFIEVLKSA